MQHVVLAIDTLLSMIERRLHRVDKFISRARVKKSAFSIIGFFADVHLRSLSRLGGLA
jgi:hypothetical protein